MRQIYHLEVLQTVSTFVTHISDCSIIMFSSADGLASGPLQAKSRSWERPVESALWPFSTINIMFAPDLDPTVRDKIEEAAAEIESVSCIVFQVSDQCNGQVKSQHYFIFSVLRLDRLRLAGQLETHQGCERWLVRWTLWIPQRRLHLWLPRHAPQLQR